MKRRYAIGMCFLLGLSVLAIKTAVRVVAGEPLPDASVLARGYSRPRNQKPPEQPTTSEVTLTGVIDNVRSNGLMIKASKSSKGKDQKEWLVFAQSDSSEFTIRGTAMPEYLRKGQNIELSGQIVSGEKGDKAKEDKVADKVKELTVFSRKGALAAPKKVGEKDPAVVPGLGRIEAAKPAADPEAALTAPDEAKSKGGKSAAKHEAVANGPKEKIIGRIEKYDEKGLTVARGQQTIHVDLVDLPTINVELCDPKLIPDTKDISKSRIEGKGMNGHVVSLLAGDLVGAKIVVQGTATETKSEHQCTAKSIDITLAKPLTGKKSTKSAKPTLSDDKKTAADK